MMNTQQMSRALRDKAETISDGGVDPAGPAQQDLDDAAELIRVLARIVEGKPVAKAFGAPGDWGYSTPIGAALAAREE